MFVSLPSVKLVTNTETILDKISNYEQSPVIQVGLKALEQIKLFFGKVLQSAANLLNHLKQVASKILIQLKPLAQKALELFRKILSRRTEIISRTKEICQKIFNCITNKIVLDTLTNTFSDYRLSILTGIFSLHLAYQTNSTKDAKKKTFYQELSIVANYAFLIAVLSETRLFAKTKV